MRQPRAGTMKIAALLLALLATAALCLRADALKSRNGNNLVVETQPQPAQQLEVDAHDHEHDHDHEHEESGTVVRCRFCGAAVASKKDYIGLHDTSKAVASKRESVLGDNGELHTFVNPSRVEMELAGFKKSLGIESEMYTKKASFFENYNWRDVRCGSCKRHLGWKFHHDDLQQCINTKTIESITALTKSQEELKASMSEKQRKAQIVEQAMEEDDCVLATSGWWTYQVCYKKEVRQFHEEPDGSRPSDWSMGVYVPEANTFDTPDMGLDVVQYFAGGQHCDENGEQRSTKVVYTCCKSKPPLLAIDSVDEPTLCSYIINICVPELCEKDTDDLGSALEAEKYAQACEKELGGVASSSESSESSGEGEEKAESSKTQGAPLSFTALRWSTVISEDSSELDWAREMQFKA